MKVIKGKTVLITGGAQGMGKAYLDKAVEEGATNVIIWDVNEAAMRKVDEEYKYHSTRVYTYKVDVTNTGLIYSTAHEVLLEIGPVDLLINNAGIVDSDYFQDQTKEKIDLTMQINSIAPMHIARAFIESMASLEEAHIVNIASGAAYIYCPKIITYCASKWAILGWSEGLNVELKETCPSIKVTTVTPGHIDTGMFDGAHFFLMPKIPTEEMVNAVWQGIKKNKTLISRPKRLSFIPAFKAFLGRSKWNWIAKRSGLNDFMAH
ncbi:SDR family NAD(P)-dependent oxidoreductase [Flammeovirga yaeyamensis]|uniref:SDR family NAD(P)-dependent oxidoreductase n=1 Tax=Flammeovirga yaeyamensis TaxID=367791 RepID=A0AAX1N4X8_9BACT|nr:SDR family NAD(P)-dependent oxidoreductase [Flammeovirga yaeyamensis]MBB3700156.1 short-subunit dehydrogenase [Flammeovirga yaeyamensis]NMF37214.1 SDR family NAD(P)-dependent oxidoreductase [Flammeovirga yaeyamensis]QWG00903.1 SDR family NAD(P)-dependent oxidoreductase [Flammeovirga yaeyamensis]